MAYQDLPVAGSSAWTCGKEYQDEYAVRIKNFLDTINQEALERHASSLRENIPCTISDNFSVGSFNLVRKISFRDGVEWVARLRMPALDDHLQPYCNISLDQMREKERKKVLREMKSELATMEFVRRNTDIPIPKVHDYNLREDNNIGCPFFILDYVPGSTAEEVSQSYSSKYQGIPAQFRKKFFQQLAEIIVKLASVRLPFIGSIFPDEKDPDNKIVVGPLIETGTGPYISIREFYAEYPIELAKSLQNDEDELIDGQEALVAAFRNLSTEFVPSQTDLEQTTPSSDYGLANYDLNPNNILVDEEFNILAVIDWDTVVAVPDAALHRFPFLMGVDPIVPGQSNPSIAEMNRAQLGQWFAEIVEDVGRDRGGLFTKSGFFSKEAIAFRALNYMKMKQGWVNQDWARGLEWLKEH